MLLAQGYGSLACKPTVVLRYSDTASSQCANYWMQKELRGKIVASRRELTFRGVVTCADDASGHGLPSENTLVSYWTDQEKKTQYAWAAYGTACLNMVHNCLTHDKKKEVNPKPSKIIPNK